MRTRARAISFCAFAMAIATAPAAFAQRHASKDPNAGKKDPNADDKDKDKDDQKIKTLEMSLSIGENKTIPATDVRNYSEGTPGIVDVKLTSDSSQFVIVGQHPGSTSLLLIKKNGTEVNWVMNVFPRSPDLVESEVRQLLDGYYGVRVRRVGARFFIEGGVSTEGDVSRIKQIAALYPGQVESLVAIGGGLDRQTNIRIDFFFVQYDKNSSYGVGINWPAHVGDPSITQNTFGFDFIAGTTTAQTSIVNQPLPGLDIGVTHGWAKVIKQATVITTNGIEASFENGGEQNFNSASGLTSSIQKIAFGTTLTVLPRFDASTRDLQIKVDADISDLVPPQSSGTVLPGRQTSQLKTLVHMKLGQSLVLSGIHTKSDRHSVSGLPLLSEIPVLGILFGTHSDQKDEVEGAVFVVPSVVENPTRPAFDMVNEAMSQYEEYSGKMRGLATYPKQPKLPPPPQ